MRPRLAVFGAGYVGGAVAQAALARGWDVTALTRNPDKARQLRDLGVAVVTADLAAADWHAQVDPDCEYVLNAVSSGGGGIEGYRRSYVDGQRSLLAWARSARQPGTLVYTSSTSVYPQDGGVRVDESATTEEGETTGGVLREAERLALAWPGRAFVLRLAGIYGPGRHHILDQLQAGAGPLPGRGEHRLNLAHRDDIVAAIFAAWASSQPSAVFNVADDGAAPKAEVVTWLCVRLGLTPPGFTGEGSGVRRRLVPDRIIANDRIKAALGWTPQFLTYREGYAEILAALRGSKG